MAADVLEVQQFRPHEVLVVELVPGVDELLLVDELGLDEVCEGEDGLEINFLLGEGVALVGDLYAEVPVL